MGCATSKRESDDEAQRRNPPRKPPSNPAPPPPSPPPPPPPAKPQNVNAAGPPPASSQNAAGSVSQEPTIGLGSEMNFNMEEQTESDSEQTIAANHGELEFEEPTSWQDHPANVNAGDEDDSGHNVGAILVLGAMSAVAAQVALSYLTNSSKPTPVAPQPNNDGACCGPCKTKGDNLQHSLPEKRHPWVESHEDYASVNAKAGGSATVDDRANFNARGGFDPENQ